MPQAGHPGQVGEVEAFFTSWRLTTNVIDDNLPYEVHKYGTNSCAVVSTCGLFESIKRCINKDNVEALNGRALPSTNYEIGAIRTWVYVPNSHSGWSTVSLNDEEWTCHMQG